MEIRSVESALVIIDMQKDFCYEDGALFVGEGAKEIIERIKRLIKKAKEKKVHLIFTQDWHEPEDKEFRIWGHHCIKNTRGAEIINELREEGYIVKKKRYSAFFETALDSYLKEKGINTLLITGVVTNICILHTAGDAVLRGYNVIISRDCVATLSDYEQEYGLHHIVSVLKGIIIPSDNIEFI